ncbi:DUF1320 domain-containing protein [Sedimentitalea sp. JM2-8]|uniref:DUF1320 domain-containing protein n=1 Tax=Sedimentitalea xiamensis TaxID=3050037 RepID=A0ABT7FCC9_9RHOB|nr:DUF1320 domain-containing protein [Sedimentitalea xiamensis]MDK3072766.1 DUF1320 domain-containing protein [Sedimentitalea xiamensis]
MPYTSLAQLTDRYGEGLLISLTDRDDVATGAIDTDVIDRALADADAQIDGYLKARYRLPLDATPPLLADIAQVIACWKLYRFDPPQKVKDDYAEAIRMLKDISRGILVLDVAGAEPEGSGASGVRITDRERPLTADQMKGFI